MSIASSIASSLRFARALIATNVKSSLALRGASWLQISFMLLNNIAFFTIWWIVFDRFEEIRGWRIGHMTALYGIAAGAFGLCMAVCGGVRYLGTTIREAGLDTWLTQPRSVLMQASMSRSITSGWGDVLSAVLFLGLSGMSLGWNIPLAATLIVSGALIFIASNILIQSLAFWLSDFEDLARQFGDFLIVFSTTPFPIFDGWLRVVLFTVIPAGFVGFVPVTLLDRFDPAVMLGLLGFAFAYLLIASFVFSRGLRHYASGNRAGLRTA